MRPTKLSAQIFLELPPVLAHYIEGERSQWVELNPSRARLSLCDRPGVFTDLENLAVERRHLVEILGIPRARQLQYRIGFEQGRRDAQRHYSQFDSNARLALQASTVFGQLQGRFRAEPVRFEFDLAQRTLYGELLLHSSVEAVCHRIGADPAECPVCWMTTGYFAGHTSEILGRRVITMETECVARGKGACRFVSRLDAEWGSEADWARQALRMPSVDAELTQRDTQIAAAKQEAHRVQALYNDLNKRLRSELMLETLVAGADSMEGVLKRARMAMPSTAPVLLVGERGTGRNTLARALHAGSPRKNKPFILVDCLGLTPALIDQELFGSVANPGAGASRAHAGAVERANGGTIYLDEIARLTLDTQGQLISLLREGLLRPRSSEKPVKVDLRVIGSTQFDPLECVQSGLLREEFLYALAVVRIDLPPLCDRDSDIIRLAELFLQEARERYQRPATTLSDAFKQALLGCSWPGNLRQLRNVIEQAVVMSPGGELGLEVIPEEVLATRAKPAAPELSPAAIRAALRRAKGNRSRAARFLNVGRTTLWRAMKRMGIE